MIPKPSASPPSGTASTSTPIPLQLVRAVSAGLFNHHDVASGREIRQLRFLKPARPGPVLITGALRNRDGITVVELQMEALIATT